MSYFIDCRLEKAGGVQCLVLCYDCLASAPKHIKFENESQMDMWEEVRDIFIKNNNALKYLSENFSIERAINGN